MKNKGTTTKVSVNSRAYLYENWTDAALNCYEHQCNCFGCLMQDICSRQEKNNPYNLPPMKYVVLKLLELKGKPDTTDIKGHAYNRDFSKNKEF